MAYIFSLSSAHYLVKRNDHYKNSFTYPRDVDEIEGDGLYFFAPFDIRRIFAAVGAPSRLGEGGL